MAPVTRPGTPYLLRAMMIDEFACAWGKGCRESGSREMIRWYAEATRLAAPKQETTSVYIQPLGGLSRASKVSSIHKAMERKGERA